MIGEFTYRWPKSHADRSIISISLHVILTGPVHNTEWIDDQFR